MIEACADQLFADWHPHYTPRWLSERLACYLPTAQEGVIVDPACGAGNLLLAAAVHLRASNRVPGTVSFVGIDSSKRAVKSCEKALSCLLPREMYRVEHGDFLSRPPQSDGPPTAIVMNPPFQGYGRLSERTRRRIVHLHEMKGRFNLSYAFVRQAISVFRPSILISLLPSNWIYSRGSSFREELDGLNGSWDWEDIGDGAFAGLNVDVGILSWKSNVSGTLRTGQTRPRRSPEDANYLVRHGVATGSDAQFIRIAAKPPSFGMIAQAVRGRDISRKTSVAIWVPPPTSVDLGESFERAIDATTLASLRTRSCVRSGRRRIYEYHERFPDWFEKGPKLLLPEIVSGELRIELDACGTKFPLHSVICIRVPSIADGRALRAHLASQVEQRHLLEEAPRLSGGAARLQVGSLRDAIARWQTRVVGITSGGQIRRATTRSAVVVDGIDVQR